MVVCTPCESAHQCHDTPHLSSVPASLGAGIPRMRLAIHAASVRKEIGGRGRIPLARMAEIEREIDDCPNLFPDQAGDIRVLLGYAGEHRVSPATDGGGPEAAMVGDPGGATPGDGPRAAEAVAQQVFGASGYADRVATVESVTVSSLVELAGLPAVPVLDPQFGGQVRRDDPTRTVAGCDYLRLCRNGVFGGV